MIDFITNRAKTDSGILTAQRRKGKPEIVDVRLAEHPDYEPSNASSLWADPASIREQKEEKLGAEILSLSLPSRLTCSLRWFVVDQVQ